MLIMWKEYLLGISGILHLLRLICFLLLIIFNEIKFFTCPYYSNEFLGFNHSSILFYNILIWISLAFEIYFLLNRLLGSVRVRAKKSILILNILLIIAFILAASFTLHGFQQGKPGYLISQEDFSNRTLQAIHPCNRQRLFGILLGFVLSLFYLIETVVLLYRWKI